jgi:hypothetical protein
MPEDNLGDEEDNLGDEEDKFITNSTTLGRLSGRWGGQVYHQNFKKNLKKVSKFQKFQKISKNSKFS